MSTDKTVEQPSFEDAMSALQIIVEEMEHGELPLEQALQKFEEGIKLARQSQSLLKRAEQKVHMLVENAEGESLTPLVVENDK